MGKAPGDRSFRLGQQEIGLSRSKVGSEPGGCRAGHPGPVEIETPLEQARVASETNRVIPGSCRPCRSMESAMAVSRSDRWSPEEAFRDVFATHYGAVFGYAARRIGHDGAADAASDVFMVAWRRIRGVPAEPETLPWLYGVARRVVASHLRAKRRRDRLHARAAAHAPAGRLEHDPAGLGAALESLRESDREVLMLAAWEGLGPDAIGRALGCSKNAAAVRLHRARARLAEVWDQERGVR